MGLHLCNSYPHRISTAIMFYSPETCGNEGGDFEVMGWWNIDPGACKLVYANDLEDLNQYWYYYAFATDGAEWSGPFSKTVARAAFGGCWGVSETTSSEPGLYMQIGFRELDIGDNDDYTLTFVARRG